MILSTQRFPSRVHAELTKGLLRDRSGSAMIWPTVCATSAIAISAALLCELLRRRRISRRRKQAVNAWRRAAEPNRRDALTELIRLDYRNPTAWYLLGCLSSRNRDYSS